MIRRKRREAGSDTGQAVYFLEPVDRDHAGGGKDLHTCSQSFEESTAMLTSIGTIMLTALGILLLIALLIGGCYLFFIFGLGFVRGFPDYVRRQPGTQKLTMALILGPLAAGYALVGFGLAALCA